MRGEKTGGRTAGTPNKITSELRKSLKTVIAGEFETLPDVLKQLPPKDRLEMVIKLLPFCMARVGSVEGNYDMGFDPLGDMV
jgi:hypothetical protein